MDESTEASQSREKKEASQHGEDKEEVLNCAFFNLAVFDQFGENKDASLRSANEGASQLGEDKEPSQGGVNKEASQPMWGK